MKQRTYSNSKGYERVDHTNDAEMVNEGLRLPKLFIDRTVFKKTSAEKRLLKTLRRKGGPRGNNWTKHEPLHKFRLIVYMNRSDKVDPNHFKSTHSFMCYENEVPGILASLTEVGYNIKQAYFNNKKINTYE